MTTAPLEQIDQITPQITVRDCEVESSFTDKKTDIESGLVECPAPRFEYSPTNFFHRAFTGLGVRTSLAGSHVVRVPYYRWVRWLLVLLLVLLGVFLTPQLLPSWLGFHVADFSDLCQNKTTKIDHMQLQMENVSRIDNGTLFIEKTQAALQCMHDSAKASFKLPRQVVYPTECIPENAVARTREVETCVEPVCAEACSSFIFKRVTCKTQCTQRTCTSINETIEESQRHVLELIAKPVDFSASLAELSGDNVTMFESDSETAREARLRTQKMIKRLLFQVDLATNLYIGYALLAIIVGIPVVVQKHAFRSRALRLTLGLRQSHFVILVIAALSLWDIGYNIAVNANLRLHLANLKNDACYVDPEFSQRRLELIQYTCGNVTKQKAELHELLVNMTKAVHSVMLCEVSKVDNRGSAPMPVLHRRINEQLALYGAANMSEYTHPATCNSTLLNEMTVRAPESGVSGAKTFLASGIIAQILLKAILSGWLIHLVGFTETLALHHGKVEVFGFSNEDERELTREETDAVRRFTRDKHMVPFALFSMLLLWAVSVLVYTAVKQKGGGPDGKSNNLTLTDITETPLPEMEIVSESLAPPFTVMNIFDPPPATAPTYVCNRGALDPYP